MKPHQMLWNGGKTLVACFSWSKKYFLPFKKKSAISETSVASYNVMDGALLLEQRLNKVKFESFANALILLWFID